MLLKLNNIQVLEKKSRGKRLGRGSGSGKGKTSGRGQKGQKSRFRVKFSEGGQTSILKRLPKRGSQMKLDRGNNHNSMSTDILFDILNNSKLNLKDNTTVNKTLLQEANFIKSKDKRKIKLILGKKNTEKFIQLIQEKKIKIEFDLTTKSVKEIITLKQDN
ncbi:MAG: uL15 family ribosomal protein [Pseudomonadota bacterium]